MHGYFEDPIYHLSIRYQVCLEQTLISHQSVLAAFISMSHWFHISERASYVFAFAAMVRSAIS